MWTQVVSCNSRDMNNIIIILFQQHPGCVNTCFAYRLTLSSVCVAVCAVSDSVCRTPRSQRTSTLWFPLTRLYGGDVDRSKASYDGGILDQLWYYGFVLVFFVFTLVFGGTRFDWRLTKIPKRWNYYVWMQSDFTCQNRLLRSTQSWFEKLSWIQPHPVYVFNNPH